MVLAVICTPGLYITIFETDIRVTASVFFIPSSANLFQRPGCHAALSWVSVLFFLLINNLAHSVSDLNIGLLADDVKVFSFSPCYRSPIAPSFNATKNVLINSASKTPRHSNHELYIVLCGKRNIDYFLYSLGALWFPGVSFIKNLN